MSNSVYEAVFHQEADGTWLVDVPALEGCHSYGETLEHARRYIRDAVALWTETSDFELSEVIEEGHPA